MPKVSINLPVYNGEKHLRQLLDSILAQTLGDFQVVITDNASTDDTEAICREYVSRDPRFSYHRNHRNLGFDFSYRRGLMASFNCDYMVYVSAGDYWDPEYLEVCATALDRDPEAVVAYTHCLFFDALEPARSPELYFDRFDCGTRVSADQRYLNIISQLGMCTAYYGLIRLTAYSEILWVTQLAFAGQDNGTLAALALRGSLIQIDKPLFHRALPEYGPETYEDRYKRIFDMAGGDTGLQSGIMTIPFSSHILSHCAMVEALAADPETKNRLIGQTVQIFKQRYARQLEAEVNRVMKMLMAGKFYASFGAEADNTSERQGQWVMRDHYILLQAAGYFHWVSSWLPSIPGMNYCRALLAVFLGRKHEAGPLLDKELEANPTYRPALELQGRLRAETVKTPTTK